MNIKYVGTIDESSEAGKPGDVIAIQKEFRFVLGHNTIEGWKKGLVGMCKGEKRTLVVPPHLAYGNEGQPARGDVKPVPPGATLRFEVGLLDFNQTSKDFKNKVPNVFKQLDANGDNKISSQEIADFFKNIPNADPDHIMKREDKDGDGFISWEEASFPKVDPPEDPPAPKKKPVDPLDESYETFKHALNTMNVEDLPEDLRKQLENLPEEVKKQEAEKKAKDKQEL